MSTADWPAVRLSDVATIVMGQSPPGSTYNEDGIGLPFFQGVRDFNYRHPTPRVYCSEPSRVAQADDILLSVRAPIGRVNVADRECATGRGVAIIKPNAESDARYLEFALRSLERSWDSIEGSGSVFGNATKRDLESLVLPWPDSASERGRIAGVLGGLDDKIELNRRMGRTLEEVARALFRSWFVDFEPVRAKQAQRWSPGQSLPGLPAQLHPLFPDQLEPSPQGPIPQGWRVATLGDVVETVRGRSYKSAELSESDTALVTLKSFARGGGYREDGLKPYTGPHKPEQVVEPGEVVLACTDVTQAAEVVGRPAIVQPAPEYRRLVASLDTLIVRPREEVEMPRAFLYLLLGTPAFTAHALAHTSGTTVLHLAKAAVPNFQFALPPRDLLEAFARQAQPALNRASHTHDEIPSLAAQRDRLLTTLLTAS